MRKLLKLGDHFINFDHVCLVSAGRDEAEKIVSLRVFFQNDNQGLWFTGDEAAEYYEKIFHTEVG